MIRVFFGALAALTLWGTFAPVFAAPKAAPHAAVAPRATPVPTVADLYSLRARRRMAAYLRLRLLEWREAGLERAAAVVERRLSVDALVPSPEPAPGPAKH
jgi:hypothetical protein